MTEQTRIGLREVLPIGDGDTLRSVIVRELTVGEFRAWLASVVAGGDRDALLAVLHEGLDAADLPVFTSLEPADIEHLTPSQIREVWAKVRALNADFFEALGRLIEAGRPSDSSPSSNAPS
ncbi:hypothetical protein [Thauera sp.]|uniref:hypothetical protein n=1 Tax=Thauera sp. TaxID=1905334 RepID=UPI0039E6D8B6